MKERYLIKIKGIVQGVGFRPFIYNTANEMDLSGIVYNNSLGVVVEAEGEKDTLTTFVGAIRHKHPQQAFVESLDYVSLPIKNDNKFAIVESEKVETQNTYVSPDLAICNDCIAELNDEKDRRYRYPFINCTNCGPRLTIIEDIPYDRAMTSMKHFPLCAECMKEFTDPSDRRFHAQAVCCPSCGPHLELIDNKRQVVPTVTDWDIILKTAEDLLAGKVIAIKGLGGFHLAVVADDDNAVSLLRTRKIRENKPFAVMCKDVEQAGELCYLCQNETELLNSVQSPIVLLKKRRELAFSVAPKQTSYGIMLPYTPLHYLLLHQVGKPLIMTSGNLFSETICSSNMEALEKLSKVADYFVLNDRDIVCSVDDSVVKVVDKRHYFIRRSRGYAPFPVITKESAKKQILACGSDLKNTICLFKENKLYLSHYIGDLENLSNYQHFDSTVQHYKTVFKVEPDIVAVDMHPGYYSSNKGKELNIEPIVQVQHHHAHIASCLADNDYQGQAIGVSFDGTGYGTDGNIWGGEFLLVDGAGFTRVAHLDYFTIAGGESAIKEPYKVALSFLYKLYGSELQHLDIPFINTKNENKLRILVKAVEQNINCFTTSSMGRLFDLVSSLLMVCEVNTYDAQAAIELEQVSRHSSTKPYAYDIVNESGTYKIKVDTLIRGIIKDLQDNKDIGEIAYLFHNTIANIVNNVLGILRDRHKVNVVALSGGVWQNTLLLTLTLNLLRKNDFTVLYHKRFPTNDEGISIGQAIIANRLQP